MCLDRRGQGFSLIELAVVLAVFAILTVLAAPSLNSVLASQRISTAVFDFTASLMLARSEAIKRNDTVTITFSNGGGGQFGWRITSTGGEVIQSAEVRKGVLWEFKPSTLTAVRFQNTGRAVSVPTSTTTPAFQLEATSAGSANIRCVSLSLSGLPTAKSGACSS